MEHHARRVEKRRETNNARIASSTSDATEAVGESSQERARRVSAREYGPPALQIDYAATIMRDASPGARFRRSYDKVGRVANVVVGDVNAYTAKALFESYSEDVDELWLQKRDPEGMANTAARASKKQKTLKDESVAVADLRGKLRVERRRSRGCLRLSTLNLPRKSAITTLLSLKVFCFFDALTAAFAVPSGSRF